jgi:branched-chain amino acid transport system substrate-binding protein
MGMKKKILACLCALTMVVGLVTGCGKSETSSTDASTASTKAANSESTNVESTSAGAAQSDNVAVPTDPNKIFLGLVAARTGTNKASGEMNLNGASLAVDEINAKGGILGKQVELVVADEIDNLQASVNATNKLLSDESISAIVGTNFSQNILAVTDAVLEAKIPYIACGSNNKIADAKNPYIWQPRNLDYIGASIIAKYAYETLGIKNPAIMYSTIPNSMGPGEQVAKYYAENYKITVPKNMMLGYSEDEKNFAPIIAQVKASGADGLICIGNINPFVLISKAIADAGLDIPRVANAAINSNIVLENAGAAANGWYATCDWFSTLDTEVGQIFQKNYKAAYGKDTEGTNAVTYDGVYLIKKACELANSTTDREAINNAMKQIKDYDVVLGTFSYHDDHTFLNEFYMTQIQDQTVKLVDKVKYR